MPRASQSSRKQPGSEIGRRRAERRSSTGRRSDERWESILRGASTAFQELGYAQTTLEDVAAEVGVNRATLYYYVGTKEELLIALLYGPIHQMTANIKAIARLDLEPEDKLRRILLQYTTDMTENPQLLIFLAQNHHQLLSGPEAHDIAANADEYGRVLVGAIQEGIDAGVFRDDIPAQLAMLGILGMFNWIHRWYKQDGKLSLNEIGETFADLALTGLRPQS